MIEKIIVNIGLESDIVTARQQGKKLAKHLDFSSSELTTIATAISELARNIVDYAGGGEIILKLIQQNGKQGIAIVARDNGPGIKDLELAMQDGYSTGKGLGLGLPGTKRLMDDFEIFSEIGKGTTIIVKKWRKQNAC
ncbi:MAG: anti-sigma regulatory factor [Peptococcaceae bacterium]|jgi:serine/threonine-protein kinase RsbT|nr:anti-sigma regulatory factor [Peptococcaceae bacterium]